MNPGRLFFGSFLLAKQKKGTSRRATPGSVAKLKLQANKHPAQIASLSAPYLPSIISTDITK
jgi:hypothetical protein